ncbi:GntR family transcriptional regulator [Allosalinactinospora lopnorensis]|uniref:GntR family transcriptional regulator n=1 Tax=Allosalinactinospora lopnorensis TaxID=1352348 RepID=UPI000698E267|nr:GntR family transcriptional regulator [Allosalinactinospora lopnorensis]
MEASLRRIESVALSERVYESIRTAIVRCELSPGESVRDRDLAEQLGVSRTPVRQALSRLQALGLVSGHEGGSWSVAPMTDHDIHELFELRRALEPLGLDHAQADPDIEATEIEEIASSFDEFGDTIDVAEYPHYFMVDHEFHRKLVALSRNQRVHRFYAVVESEIDRGRHFLSTGWHGRVDETLREHRAVCEALRNRDYDTARDALISHLRTGEELMSALLHRGRGPAT